MAFLTRTRLLQIASGTDTAKVLLAQPTVLYTTTAGTVVETVAEAMPLIQPANKRPPQADWWQYIVQQEVKYAVRPTVRGMDLADNARRTLVFDAAFWEVMPPDPNNPPTPQRWNTFSHQFTSKSRDSAATAIRTSMDDFLIRAHFNPNIPVDFRDTTSRIQTSTDPINDPLGILTRIQPMDNTLIDVPVSWR